MDNSILLRIKKLLALANDKRGNEAEAKAAMEKAHQLLSEHNLSMAQVDSAIESGVTENKFFEITGRLASWKPVVWGAVARLFYGYYFYSQTYRYVDGRETAGYTHTIIAEEQNADVAMTVSAFVIDQVEQLAKYHKGSGRAFISSYKHGVAHRIDERVNAIIAKAKAGEMELSDGTDLMCVSSLYDKATEAIQDYVRKKDIKVKQKEVSISEIEGFTAGMVAGDKVSLNRPVSNSVVTGRLG